MLLAITREQHRPFQGSKTAVCELSVLEPGRYHCPARDQAKRTLPRGNAVRTAHDLPGSHPGWNVERLFSKRTVGLALAPLVVGLLAGSVALAQAPSAQAPAASGAK